MDLKILLDTPPWDWPNDTGGVFLKLLADKQASVADRLIAAQLGGTITVINDQLASALLAVLGSADEADELRAAAAISLGPILEQADTQGFDDPEDVPITLRTFRSLQESLHKLYLDANIPKAVRRRILEASVRAHEEWHQDAIGEAYSSGDRDWMLTAVFGMRWVPGFDRQIVQALKSADSEIHYEAVVAAGDRELSAAWSHVVTLVKNSRTPKPLLIAAIGAVAGIRPQEAGPILVDLTDSDDEDIAEAASEAIDMAESAKFELDDEDDEEEGEWVN